MSKFIFPNENELYLRDCEPESIGIVYQAWWDNSESLQIQNGAGEWQPVTQCDIYTEAVYRVLAKPYTLEDALEVADNIYIKDKINGMSASAGVEVLELVKKIFSILGDKS